MAYPPREPLHMRRLQETVGPSRDSNDRDYQSLYRALARQLEGDPKKHPVVRRHVLDSYLRIKTDPVHPLFREYPQPTYDEREEDPFLTALAWPDEKLHEDVLSFIADALGIKVCVYKREVGTQNFEVTGEYGDQEFPIVQILQESKHGVTQYHTLYEDDTGRALIAFMRAYKASKAPNRPEVYEGRWSHREGQQIHPSLGNYEAPAVAVSKEHNDANLPRLDKSMYCLCVFNVSVDMTSQIEEAIDLFEKVMQRAPAQEVARHGPDGSVRRLRRYVGADVEFRYAENENTVSGEFSNFRQSERLCGVLSLAVDRFVVFTFYIHDMLAIPHKNTVREMLPLFRKILLNPDYAKFWFQYTNDIACLDATLAYMHQGTERPRQNRYIYYAGDSDRRDTSTFIPRFNTKPAKGWAWNAKVYKGPRPRDLFFPVTGNDNPDCPFHIPNSTAEHLNIPICPCDKGNFDVLNVFDYICRSQGMVHIDRREGETEEGETKREGKAKETKARKKTEKGSLERHRWFEVREGFNYDRFNELLFKNHRLHDLFMYFKKCSEIRVPDDVYNAIQEEDKRQGRLPKGGFFMSMSPGYMERDPQHHQLGYIIGDVISIAMAVRMATTTDDRKFLAETLLNYRELNSDYATAARQQSTLWTFRNSDRLGVPLISDFPKIWHRDDISKLDCEEPKSVDSHFNVTNIRDALDISYTEHEDQVDAARAGLDAALGSWAMQNQSAGFWGRKAQSNTGGPTQLQKMEKEARTHALSSLFDPTKFTLPDLLTHESEHNPKHRLVFKPVVPAGTAHERDLRAVLRDPTHQGPQVGVLPGVKPDQDFSAIDPESRNRTDCALSAFKDRAGLLAAASGDHESEPEITTEYAYNWKINKTTNGGDGAAAAVQAGGGPNLDTEPYAVKDYIFDRRGTKDANNKRKADQMVRDWVQQDWPAIDQARLVREANAGVTRRRLV